MTELTTLADNLRYLMEKIEGAAVGLGYSLPERRYVTVGGSVYDCPQVTVSGMTSATGIVSPEGDAAALIGPCDPIWNVSVEAAIVLQAAERNTGARGNVAPTPEAIESDTDAISAAYAVLVRAIGDVINSGDLGSITATITFGQPQGFLIAVVATIACNLWAPDPIPDP